MYRIERVYPHGETEIKADTVRSRYLLIVLGFFYLIKKMKEKELENWIFELSQTKQGREKLIHDHQFCYSLDVPLKKQFKLGGYGIIDLIAKEDDMIVGYEIKSKPFNIKYLTQCAKYLSALQYIKRCQGDIGFVHINLVIPFSNINKKEVVLLCNMIKGLSIIEYTVTPTDICFKPLTHQVIFNPFIDPLKTTKNLN